MIALFLVPVFALNVLLVFQVIEQVKEPLATHIDTIRMLFMMPLLLFSYGLYCRYFETRRALEISLPGGGKEWLAGFLVAVTLVVLLVALSSLILVTPFILTRRLWLGWGVHAGWNFMQARILRFLGQSPLSTAHKETAA